MKQKHGIIGNLRLIGNCSQPPRHATRLQEQQKREEETCRKLNSPWRRREISSSEIDSPVPHRSQNRARHQPRQKPAVPAGPRHPPALESAPRTRDGETRSHTAPPVTSDQKTKVVPKTTGNKTCGLHNPNPYLNNPTGAEVPAPLNCDVKADNYEATHFVAGPSLYRTR